MSARSLCSTVIALLITGNAFCQNEHTEQRLLVLTATQATYSIAKALSEDTPVEVVNIPDDGRELAVLRTYLDRRKDRFESLFEEATAVISLANAIPGDPLYRYAREANVRIVNIDAAVPWTYHTPGVSLIDAPQSDAGWVHDARSESSTTSPYFWLSVSNSIRMADIIANDFAALFTPWAAVITENLNQFKSSLLQMRNNHQARLLAAHNDTVFALSGDFVYLTNDLGLFVDGYFIRQDINWTEDDVAALENHLKESGIAVVVHKWTPNEAIQRAIANAGATLIVLETGDQGRLTDDDVLAVDGLQRILVSNLEKVTGALSR